MAIFPCDWSAHRYAGPQRSAYVTSAWGNDVETAQLRLCDKHLSALEEIIVDHFTLVDETAQLGKDCDVCHEDKAGILSITLYKLHEDPITYVADLCADDWLKYRTLVHVASGRVLERR